MKLILICLFTWTLTACNSGGGGGAAAPAPEVKNSKPSGDGPIVFMGDSLAFGTGSTMVNGLSTLHYCFKDSLDRTVINLGIEGATTTDSLNDIDNVLGVSPAVVVISAGGNDAIWDAYSKNFPESLTFNNLSTIYKKLTAAGALVVHMGIHPPQVGSERLPKISSIAAQEGALFVPQTMLGMWGNSQYMADRLHPNDKGYGLVCERMIKRLAPHYDF